MARFSPSPSAAAGITEGDYTEWTWKWTKTLPGGVGDGDHVDFFIDDKNDRITITWYNSAWDIIMGVFNISDFSQLFLSTAQYYTGTIDDDFAYGYNHEGRIGFQFGTGRTDPSKIDLHGHSRSFQSYILLSRFDKKTLEVWRTGVTYLWSHDITTDEAGVSARVFAISPTGKYILIMASNKKLMLYEGS